MLSKGLMMPSSLTTQAVLFDLDGTLLDTANDLGESLNYVLTQYDLPIIKRASYRPIASDGAKGLLELGFKDKLSSYNFDQLRHEFLTYYEQNIAENTEIYSGVIELIQYLEANDIAWGIVTNKPENLTLKLLPSFPEFNQCQVIVGGDTLSKRKPDPEPLLHACQQINVDPKHTLYVGDAPRDIEAGNAANMTTIIAQWGYILNPEECAQWASDFSCESPLEIKALIK
ncbi:HAD family hydrolase [Thalassotalea profundi]|uniref:Phosphoglycolate phosphatase n=1 Tax=Thalassotalea profundi TaxID=2036687 RepID=A0ABQ3ISH7_9GAMM|nr:HAD-IA family hydrolase [Thalassotalea profundi]GHE90478.1 phosphoglycolate phosphatase [Thalassotalea profundi]